MPRELSLLLTPEDKGPVTLDQNQRREILRRLERVEKLETDNARLEQEKEALRKELEEKRPSWRGSRRTSPPSRSPPLHPKLHRPAAPAEPRPKGRHPGGQPGHAPHVRPRPDHVDETLDLGLEECPECGEDLGDPSDTYERFVTELIPAYLWVLKILVHRYWCSHYHRFVQASTNRALPGRQFGPRLASTLVLLSMMGLPVRRIPETVAAMVGLEVSGGAIQGLLEGSAESLGPDCEAIHREVLRAHLVQPDETSMRVGGANRWAWSFATELAAYYELDPSRGQEVVERVLGADFPGTVVSDDWCGYNVLKGKRGGCWIHINQNL